MITKVWYSVENCGDGSAYPRFMESEALTELDQRYMDEGWGETCNGYIEIEHDGPIKVKGVLTIDEEIKEESKEWGNIEKLKALIDLKEKQNGKS